MWGHRAKLQGFDGWRLWQGLCCQWRKRCLPNFLSQKLDYWWTGDIGWRCTLARVQTAFVQRAVLQGGWCYPEFGPKDFETEIVYSWHLVSHEGKMCITLSTPSFQNLKSWLPRTIVTRPSLPAKEKVLTQFPAPMAEFFQERDLCQKLPKQTNRKRRHHLKRYLLGSPKTGTGMPIELFPFTRSSNLDSLLAKTAYFVVPAVHEAFLVRGRNGACSSWRLHQCLPCSLVAKAHQHAAQEGTCRSCHWEKSTHYRLEVDVDDKPAGFQHGCLPDT